MQNYGIQNEYDYIELFNNKLLKNLDTNSQRFIHDLFGNNVDGDEIIKCWKNRMMQKADIFIKCQNQIKGISLKCGNNNSVHSESIEEFKYYLEKLKIPYPIIDKYVSYHYGYARDKDNNIDFSKSLSSIEYKNLYQKDLDDFNNSINKTRIVIDMIERFIIRGRNSKCDIDALICGTVDNYVWILKDDLYDLILLKRCMDYTSPHIACLTIGPKKRNLDRTSNNSKDRYIVCIRWNFIRESIVEFMSKKT